MVPPLSSLSIVLCHVMKPRNAFIPHIKALFYGNHTMVQFWGIAVHTTTLQNHYTNTAAKFIEPLCWYNNSNHSVTPWAGNHTVEPYART